MRISDWSSDGCSSDLSLIYIRGVGSDAFEPTADQSVATYIDGVYLPFAHGLAQEFVKLERIEVLKGPQGTLFGRNATGGAINIVTKKPTDSYEANLDLTGGSFSNREAKEIGRASCRERVWQSV